jgi:F-box-like
MNVDNAIPTEILTEIFVQALPPRLDEDGRLAFQSIRSVCSTWRNLAFSSPIFWSSISVDHRISDSKPNSESISRLERWFSRSGSAMPLELEFLDPGERLQDTEPLRSLILHHQQRWKCLSLCMEPECFWDVVTGPPTSNWLNLHTLTIWLYDFSSVEI